MDYTINRATFRRSAFRLTIGAHLFGIFSIILLLVWLLHFLGGIEYDSDYQNRFFNVHPFLMPCGFVFLAGQVMMTYKTVKADKRLQTLVHYHDMVNAEDMYSLHSCIGMGTVCLFGLQWLVGLSTNMIPGISLETRARILPWLVNGGRTLMFVAVFSALTGLMESAAFLKLQDHHEGHLLNFTGLSILLFGIFVDLSVTIGRYV